MHIETSHLFKTLQASLPSHEFKTICQYLFSNPGKLFRSKLISNLALDLNFNDQQACDSDLLKAFVEIHHTYTLIHDDLPAMDDDDIRRGQKSTHILFGEANAILAGDALLISSFQSLLNIKSEQLVNILKLTTWATGAKGLINGQFLDLKPEEKSFEEILRIHELKTSRLFQVCTLGSYYLSNMSSMFKLEEFKDYMKLGSCIGILFQLLDDYKDRDEKGADINNLFAIDSNKAISSIKLYHQKLNQLFDKYQLNEVEKQISGYTKSVDVLI